MFLRWNDDREMSDLRQVEGGKEVEEGRCIVVFLKWGFEYGLGWGNGVFEMR